MRFTDGSQKQRRRVRVLFLGNVVVLNDQMLPRAVEEDGGVGVTAGALW